MTPTRFEDTPGLWWHDTVERFEVMDHANNRVLYYGPDEAMARSIASYAERIYGRRFHVRTHPVVPKKRRSRPAEAPFASLGVHMKAGA